VGICYRYYCPSLLLTVRELRSSGWYAGWRVTSCCATVKEIYTLVKNFMLLSILKKWHLTIVFSANVNFQQLYVFAMNNKASPPSTDPTKKCGALFPYFPSLESRLAGEHTVSVIPLNPSMEPPSNDHNNTKRHLRKDAETRTRWRIWTESAVYIFCSKWSPQQPP
jgi:hypothetical protein